ncbi:MAG: GAF domain-containing protein [Nodosilinea sp.]
MTSPSDGTLDEGEAHQGQLLTTATDPLPWANERLFAHGAPVVEPDWLSLIQHSRHLILAVVAMETTLGEAPQPHRVLFANDSFCRLTGIPFQGGALDAEFLGSLSPADGEVLRGRFRQHFFNGVLQYHYGEANLVAPRLLHAPLVIALTDPETGQRRQVELRLSTAEGGLEVTALAPEVAASLAICWPQMPTREQVTDQLLNAESPLQQVLTLLTPDRYTARGSLLIEGVDVTSREISQALIQRLVGRESVLEPTQFNQVNALMQQLFEADGSLLLSAEGDQAQLFTGLDQPEWTATPYPIAALQDSVFFRATEAGQVINIPDLTLDCVTQGEQDLVQGGVRSLLLIPLSMRSALLGHSAAPMIGLVGLTSTRLDAFDQADCSQAMALIPALTAALRHSVQDRFTNIHPSVRWRFEQEAERRSWGLPPAPIVFETVYPLYGISDLRGSSDERNRAIQHDLLAQFELALGVVEAVCKEGNSALVQQLRLDLAGHIATLKQGITVDSEVTLLRYLQQDVETHFPGFAHLSPMASAAIKQYQAALDADHGGVYAARARYDQTIGYINTLLRDTWNQWQPLMQAITPHYCDLEATDGIDHMIYAGQAIDPNFTDFQLMSLRYEQLRAVCDCARQGFTLKATCDTDMELTHLVLVQAVTVDIVHDETTERLFDVRGTRDTRYEIVKKRIDKACDAETGERITQPGQLTIVYSTAEEWQEYQRYLRYLHREGLVDDPIEQGVVEPLQGVNGLKFARVQIRQP